MSRRGRLAFVAAGLLVFALLAVFIAWSTSSTGPAGKTPVTVTLAPGATRPAGLTTVDLNDVGQHQARFNADTGVPRLVLALASTDGAAPPHDRLATSSRRPSRPRPARISRAASA